MAKQQFLCNVYRINNTTSGPHLLSFPINNVVLRPVPAGDIAFSNSLNVYGIIQSGTDQYWVKETISEISDWANS